MAMKDVSIVLAHGAWADGSSWARVITALKAEGTTVSAAPLPLTSLADDVAALNRSLDRTEGPIVLVGHAYAGAVIALARPERVKALVFVTALAPDEGEKVADVFYRLEPHPQAPRLAPDINGLIGCPKKPSRRRLRRMRPPTIEPSWPRCSGRYRRTALLFLSRARFGGTFRVGFSSPRTIE
jgi:pimeloyl-ACP methyl ester carboxylesterase